MAHTLEVAEQEVAEGVVRAEGVAMAAAAAAD